MELEVKLGGVFGPHDGTACIVTTREIGRETEKAGMWSFGLHTCHKETHWKCTDSPRKNIHKFKPAYLIYVYKSE